MEAQGWDTRWVYRAMLGPTAPQPGFNHSRLTYDHMRKVVVIGRDRVTIDGIDHTFDRRFPDGSLQYRADDGIHAVRLSAAEGDDALGLTWTRGTGSITGTVDTYLLQEVDSSVWSARLGLLADQHDAAVGPWVEYLGSVSILAGDGAVLAGGATIHQISGGCQIRLRLNTVTGALNADPVECVTEKGVRVAFTLPGLRIQGSIVVRDLRDLPPQGHLSGPVETNLQDPPMTSINLSFERVDGILYGLGASTLRFSGAADQGIFDVMALRQ